MSELEQKIENLLRNKDSRMVSLLHQMSPVAPGRWTCDMAELTLEGGSVAANKRLQATRAVAEEG